MKKLFILLWVLSVGGIPLFGQSNQTKKVAILETVDKEGVVPYGVKLMVRSKLAYAITNTPGYEAYDRVNISSIMNEQEFQRTGLVSDDEIKRLGVMTGADYVVVAEAARLDDTHIMLYTTILAVETARVVQTSNIQTSTDIDAMEEACREMAARLLGVEYIKNNPRSNNNPGEQSTGPDFIETVSGLNMKMVYVEGGEFSMGSGTNGQVARRVRLDSFYIGECEVTQAQWAEIMGTSIQQQASKAGSSAFRGVGPDYPMYYVSWEEAQAFCQVLSRMTGRTYCLPTEAQWEYAACGGKKTEGTEYSGSWTIDAVAWYNNNCSSKTHPVKNKQPNGLGLYDMTGNVWEWCSDWYSSNYNMNDTNNPTGPSSGSLRVLRGGSWGNDARTCRVTNRNYFNPKLRGYYYGFRVVVLP